MLRWLSWSDGHWSPAVSPFYFEHIVKSTFRMGPPDRELLKASVNDLVRFANGARRTSRRQRSSRVRTADHRRLSDGVDGDVLARIGNAVGGFSERRALARRSAADSGVGRSVAGQMKTWHSPFRQRFPDGEETGCVLVCCCSSPCFRWVDLCPLGALAAPASVDLILTNGKVFTGDPERPSRRSDRHRR